MSNIHDTRGLPLITSTGVGCFFVMSGNLWWSAKSLSMKHAEVSESNKTQTFAITGTIKQGEVSEIRIGPLINDCATFSSRTIPTVVGHLRFPIPHPPPMIDYSLKHFDLV
jgi:hypothetical protein